MHQRLRYGSIAAGLLAGLAGAASGQASFAGLGDLPGGAEFSVAMGISAGGGVVCGYSHSGASGPGRYEAFVWTESRGIEGLGFLGGGETESQGAAVSADGSVVAGGGGSGLVVPPSHEGFLWTAGGGLRGVGVLGQGGAAASPLVGLSAGGDFAVGNALSGGASTGFLWSDGGGFTVLGPAAGDWLVVARAVDDSGGRVVGYASTAAGQRARVWRAADGWAARDLFQGVGAALACSADGRVVTGRMGAGDGQQILRWTESGGAEGFAAPEGTGAPSGWSVSGDGRVIVGTAVLDDSGGAQRAIVWVEGEGSMELGRWLESRFAVDLGGWRLAVARGVSADGRSIAGWGVNPAGATEAWRVVVPWVSCPPDLTLDGVLDSADVAAFAAAFGRGESDWNGDGRVDTRDFIAYLSDFAAGCE